MPVTIPSPTPITGVRNLNGSSPPPGQRLPIEVLQKKHPISFALYIQALLAWQEDQTQSQDSDNVKGTSYFQVAGIHGVPHVPWQADPTPGIPNVGWGYCTHKSVLFVPWHRPYLLLYEQIIYQYALDIVNSATGCAKETYTEALGFVRLPYWDFNKNPGLPAVAMQEGIVLTVPSASPGQTKTISLPHNPLYSFKFKSDYAWTTLQQRLGWKTTPNWRESKRCPDFDGNSHQEISNSQMQSVGKDYKSRAYSLLTSVRDFAEFTCMAYKPGQNYDSVEVWHNFVHNYTGTNDKNKFDYYPTGNTTDVQSSSFDPIFWMLHTHIDRMAAIWQAMNYQNIKIDTLPSLLPRWTAGVGTKEGGTSNLEPWHTSGEHSMSDYWKADATKDLESTFSNGYYYPETPLELRNDQAAMQSYAVGQVNSLYAPTAAIDLINALAPSSTAAAPFEAAAVTEDAPREDSEQEFEHTSKAEPTEGLQGVPYKDSGLRLVPPVLSSPEWDAQVRPIESVEWRAFVRVKGFALMGTWGIHLFFGEPPADSSEWFMSDNRVGTVNILSNEDISACPNCQIQQASGLLVTGMVLLSAELTKRGIDILDMGRGGVVEQYLKDKLTWRVVKNAQNVEITPEMALTIGVAARKVIYPLSPTELPQWSLPVIYRDATAGKVGGLTEDVEEV